MLVSLALGAIGVGIYIANFRSKVENKNKNFSVATVSLIMVASLLVGLLGFAIYYGITYKPTPVKVSCVAQDSDGKPCCPTCGWGPDDTKAFTKAQNTVAELSEKVNQIPRHIRLGADCDAVSPTCPSGGCCGIDKKNLVHWGDTPPSITDRMPYPIPRAPLPPSTKGDFKGIPKKVRFDDERIEV